MNLHNNKPIKNNNNFINYYLKDIKEAQQNKKLNNNNRLKFLQLQECIINNFLQVVD